MRGSFINSAVVSATTPDPNPADDSASVNINVGAADSAQFRQSCEHQRHVPVSPSTGRPGRNHMVQASTNLSQLGARLYQHRRRSFHPSRSPIQRDELSYRFYRVLTGP